MDFIRNCMLSKQWSLCYTEWAMNQKIHLHVSRKNPLTILMTVLMVCSAVTRIVITGVKGIGFTGSVWSQIVLPAAASLLYAAIALFDGEEFFHKTAIPVWMACAYSALWIHANVANHMTVWLFWIALVFLACVYTEITAGRRIHGTWLLPPVSLSVLGTMLYYHRELIITRNWTGLYFLVPDVLMLIGAVVLQFAIRVHPIGEYHPTWGDRPDGRRVRTLPAMAQVSPYIMETRVASMNFFEEPFEITQIDRYIRQKRKEGMTSFGFLHVILACYCKGVAKYPALNRFISGQKIYSRGEDIQFCMTIKKEMTASSPDTVIKVHLSPRDNAQAVYEKVNAAIEEVKNTPLDSGFDHTADAFLMIPGVLLRLFVQLLKLLDYFGLLPRFLLEVSPFHGSVFFTSMGSLGIRPIYHHLYDFGNLPVFGAFGIKRRATEVQEDGTLVTHKYVDCKFTMDERIADGYYYAAFFKYLKRFIAHPELLDEIPTQIERDID